MDIYTLTPVRKNAQGYGAQAKPARKNGSRQILIKNFNDAMMCEWSYPRLEKGQRKLTFKQATALIKEYVRYYNRQYI